MATKLHYIMNDKGHKTAVIVPIEKWELIVKNLPKALGNTEWEEGLVEAMVDVRRMQKGEIPKPNISDFLAEL